LSGLVLLCGALAAVAGPGGQVPPAPANDESHELQQLLDRVNGLSDWIGKNSQSPEAWSRYLDQAELLLQVAARSQGEERDRWLRMAVESFYAAAIQAPATDGSAAQRLAQLPDRISHDFSNTAITIYAASQVIQAEYTRRMTVGGEDIPKAQAFLAKRLMQFALKYPKAPEAIKAVQECAQLCETLGRKEDACRCYRYLMHQYPGQSLARRAEGALWRLGLGGERVVLNFPSLYAASATSSPLFDMNDLVGKEVVVYFWSSAFAQVTEDLSRLKQLGDKFQRQGLELVYVNVDEDTAKAKEFLAGRLMVGTHLHSPGGLNTVSERFGIDSLPHLLLIGREGNLKRHSITLNEVESYCAQQYDNGSRRNR
jgi:hypothetical protein